jgi:hypothetical protein
VSDRLLMMIAAFLSCNQVVPLIRSVAFLFYTYKPSHAAYVVFVCNCGYMQDVHLNLNPGLPWKK